MALHTIVEHDTTHIKPYIDNVKQALSNEADARAELGAHNFFDLDIATVKANNTAGTISWSGNAATFSGLTITLNSDKSITLNGTAGVDWNFYLTATGDLGFAGKRVTVGVDNDKLGVYVWDTVLVKGVTGYTANGVTIPSNYTSYRIMLSIKQGLTVSNLKIYPIVTLAGDLSNIYTPVVPTNSQLLSYKDNGVLGAKNYLKNTATSGNNGSGVSWVVNADKTLTITKSDSSTANIDLALAITLPKGTYKISGTPSDGDYANKYAVFVAIGSTTIATDATNTLGLKDTFTVTNEAQGYNVRIIIRTGSGEFSNIVFSPMIRLASDTDPTYQPYAMTNKELTDKASLLDLLYYPTTVISSVDLNDIKTTGVYRLGGSITNSASGNSGALLVLANKDKTSVRQVQFLEADNNIATRVLYNATWTSWQKVTLTSM